MMGAMGSSAVLDGETDQESGLPLVTSDAEGSGPVVEGFTSEPAEISSLGALQPVFAGGTLKADGPPAPLSTEDTPAESVRSDECEDAAPVLRVNDMIGSYWIESDGPIGHGSFGTVYRARHSLLNRVVALKILHRQTKHARCRFLREARVLDRVEHPGIVSIYDLFEHPAGSDGHLVLAMEYIDGRNLYQVWKDGERRLRTAVLLIREVARGLEALHAAGIVHRDLKPQNVMVSGGPEDYRCHLIDFGLTKDLAGDGLQVSNPRALLGTPIYYSPEQYSCEVGTYSDIYALGLIFYSFVTGRIPHVPSAAELARVREKHLADPRIARLDRVDRELEAARRLHSYRRLAAFRKRRKEDPRPPVEINPSIGPSINEFILRMLSRDTEARPRAREVIDTLGGWLG